MPRSRHLHPNNLLKRCGFESELSWRHIVIFIVSLYILRHVIVFTYCFLCHELYFRWADCPTDAYFPSNFSDVLQLSLRIVEEPPQCAETHRVFVYVHSSYSQFSRRALIRKTWARPILQRDDFKFVFVIGSPPTYDADLERELSRETMQFNDVLRLGFVDSYYNITLKTRAIYNWTYFRCSQVRHVVRVDTDVVLHFSSLLRFLGHIRSAGPHVYGYCRPHDCVTRLSWSKTCLPQTFYTASGRAMFFPRYCFGFSYVVTMDFLREVVLRWRNAAASADNIFQAYLPLDDLHATGFMGNLANAWRINHPRRFTYLRKFDSYFCQNSVVASAAYEDDSEMAERWSTYVSRCRLGD